MKAWSRLFSIFLVVFFVAQVSFQESLAVDVNPHDPKIAGTVNFNDMDVGAEYEGRLILELLQNEKTFARTEVINPRFPQAYLLGPKNTVVPGVPFKGEFSLAATLKDAKGTDIAKADYQNILAGSRGIILTLKKPQLPSAK